MFYMIDGHVHLDKGPLTKEYVWEFIKEAVNKGIDELQILNHTHRFKEFRSIYTHCENVEAQIQWFNRDFKDSVFEYICLIEEMKKEELPIKISFGLEVCYAKESEEKIRELLKIYNWDFLIGSVHFVNGIAYDSSWSVKELWDKYPTDDIYKDYYKEIFNLIESDIFTQLGHPDTIKMFNYYPAYDLSNTYNTMADLLNKHSMKVENNVGCFYRYNHKDKGLSNELLEVFKAHNCQMITVSDAHIPDDVGNFIKDVWNITMN